MAVGAQWRAGRFRHPCLDGPGCYSRRFHGCADSDLDEVAGVGGAAGSRRIIIDVIGPSATFRSIQPRSMMRFSRRVAGALAEDTRPRPTRASDDLPHIKSFFSPNFVHSARKFMMQHGPGHEVGKGMNPKLTVWYNTKCP